MKITLEEEEIRSAIALWLADEFHITEPELSQERDGDDQLTGNWIADLSAYATDTTTK